MKTFKNFLIENTDTIVDKEAHHVRKFFEYLHKHHPDEGTSPLEPSLKGSCHMAAQSLVHRLKKHNIHSTYHVGHFHDGKEKIKHGWVTVGGKIVDVAATQFNDKKKKYNPVHITSADDPKYVSLRSGISASKAVLRATPKGAARAARNMYDYRYGKYRKHTKEKELPENYEGT